MPNKNISARDLAAALSKEHELTKKKGQEMLGDLVAMITKHLKNGERVKITGLGILQVRNRTARMGRKSNDRRTHSNQSQQKGSFPRH
jgi:DNA-binding protein HU-beta